MGKESTQEAKRIAGIYLSIRFEMMVFQPLCLIRNTKCGFTVNCLLRQSLFLLSQPKNTKHGAKQQVQAKHGEKSDKIPACINTVHPESCCRDAECGNQQKQNHAEAHGT